MGTKIHGVAPRTGFAALALAHALRPKRLTISFDKKRLITEARGRSKVH